MKDPTLKPQINVGIDQYWSALYGYAGQFPSNINVPYWGLLICSVTFYLVFEFWTKVVWFMMHRTCTLKLHQNIINWLQNKVCMRKHLNAKALRLNGNRKMESYPGRARCPKGAL